ncbi:unnamed protein product [Phaedon cochleariae]|uniref:WKF domain-containing protein n=1 Tax=Phaedon cochleariae TaxID=80249 RepID=A0A9P0DSG3_PHACE|nr:unnamed protein product [Phaedon cochleariae]
MAGRKSKKNIITFDEECDGNKMSARTFSKQPKSTVPVSVPVKTIGENGEQSGDIPMKKRKKKQNIQDETNNSSTIHTDHETYQEQANSEHEVISEEHNNLDTEQKIKPKESIRERKRKKYAELLQTKKSKVDQDTQQLALNYLSKWKHAREEWKFEKLRQIWLSENLFNSMKLPDDMWLTAVEYFSASKGFIRKLIMREALKVIDTVETDNDNVDECQSIKLNRARDIIQYLKEV